MGKVYVPLDGPQRSDSLVTDDVEKPPHNGDESGLLPAMGPDLRFY